MINRDNYQLSQEFLNYLSDIMRTKRVSVDRYRFYLRHILIWLDEIGVSDAYAHTPTFHTYIEANQATRALAPQTISKIMQVARRFFVWCKTKHPTRFKRLSRDWISSLRPARGAYVPKPRLYFTLDEMLKIAALSIPVDDLALRRDQAAACMLFLSGMRVGAFVSLPIRCVNLDSMTIQQFPMDGVKTKNTKHATTFLLNIPTLLAVVRQWDVFVRQHLPDSAMWFAHIVGQWGEQHLASNMPADSRGNHYNRRLKALLINAGVPPRSSHKFRHGHAVFGLQNARTLADYKAISQNLMHGNIQITDGIYADLVGSEVKARVTGLGSLTNPATTTLSFNPTGQLDPDLAHALQVLAERLAR